MFFATLATTILRNLDKQNGNKHLKLHIPISLFDIGGIRVQKGSEVVN